MKPKPFVAGAAYAAGARQGPAIAVIGTFPPRRCGLATFTDDTVRALRAADPGARVSVCAIRPAGFADPFGPDVCVEIDQHDLGSYVRAAARLNARGVSVVSLQHEFGIFGGDAGEYVLSLLERLEAAVVTTMHTVPPEPDAAQAKVIDRLLALSAKIVVMARRGRDMLVERYGADPGRVEIIPHGAPARPRPDTQAFKARLGFSGRKVLMTFGLLGRGKGLETMIAAMPAIAARHPSALYVVLGATHPNVVIHEGESYRRELMELCGRLGVADNVRFIDKYALLPDLLDHLSAADVYVTPYPNEAQVTSGTLAYAYALGRAIVSTPYWHAAELLADDRGVLCPFNDSAAFAAGVNGLLDDPARLDSMGARAYEDGRAMHWPVVGRRCLDVFAVAAGRESASLKVIDMPKKMSAASRRPSLAYIDRMTDHVGLLQHAVMDVANRQEGYCVDDNARALTALTHFAEQGLTGSALERLEATYAAFIQNAWNPEVGRFRNFLAYGAGGWLDAQGSEDSHGRTLVALARARRFASTPDRRVWADGLFRAALPAVADFTSPRAGAHAIHALLVYDEDRPGEAVVGDLLARLAERLRNGLAEYGAADWRWFEPFLAYENAILPGALIAAADRLGDRAALEEAVAALEWLARVQAAEEGWFRPVGNDCFGKARFLGTYFDQQPIEAYAMIAAYDAALAATGDRRWLIAAEGVFRWFEGWNDLGAAMYDAVSGACHDGLHADRANANKGAESCLSALFAHLHLRAMRRRQTASDAVRTKPEQSPVELVRIAGA